MEEIQRQTESGWARVINALAGEGGGVSAQLRGLGREGRPCLEGQSAGVTAS